MANINYLVPSYGTTAIYFCLGMDELSVIDMITFLNYSIISIFLLLSCGKQEQQQNVLYRHNPEPVSYVQEDSLEMILHHGTIIYNLLVNAYNVGYEEGYYNALSKGRAEILDNNSYRYKDPDMSHQYMEGYRKGMKEGYQEHLHIMDSISRSRQIKPQKSSLPKGYQHGYDDGYDDGCENDYKDSWNPRSRDSLYQVNYNEGYNEGFEYGRLEYWEDYVLEGVEEDWW